jgi:ParB family chromosome partitioning protein
MVKETGLGKGFGSLLPDSFDSSLLIDKKDRVQKLFISEIVANPDQPRRHFDETAIDELANSKSPKVTDGPF